MFIYLHTLIYIYIHMYVLHTLNLQSTVYTTYHLHITCLYTLRGLAMIVRTYCDAARERERERNTGLVLDRCISFAVPSRNLYLKGALGSQHICQSKKQHWDQGSRDFGSISSGPGLKCSLTLETHLPDVCKLTGTSLEMIANVWETTNLMHLNYVQAIKRLII